MNYLSFDSLKTGLP